MVFKEKDPGESTVFFLRRKTGLEDGLRPKRTSKLRYRAQLVDAAFQKLSILNNSLPTVYGLLPFIHSIARLYANSFLEIEVDEMESEAVVYILDFIAKGRPIMGFPMD